MKIQPVTIDELSELATEVAERSGLSLYDLEFVGSGNSRTLRVYIDGENGVSIDDCADFSRGYSVLLDAKDLIPGGKYELEVSSPGLERRLTKPWHFEKALGKKVQVKTVEAVIPESDKDSDKPMKAKTLVGELKSVESDAVVIEKDNRDWKVDFENVDRARMVFEEPKKNKKKK